MVGRKENANTAEKQCIINSKQNNPSGKWCFGSGKREAWTTCPISQPAAVSHYCCYCVHLWGVTPRTQRLPTTMKQKGSHRTEVMAVLKTLTYIILLNYGQQFTCPQKQSHYVRFSSVTCTKCPEQMQRWWFLQAKRKEQHTKYPVAIFK